MTAVWTRCPKSASGGDYFRMVDQSGFGESTNKAAEHLVGFDRVSPLWSTCSHPESAQPWGPTFVLTGLKPTACEGGGQRDAEKNLLADTGADHHIDSVAASVDGAAN